MVGGNRFTRAFLDTLADGTMLNPLIVGWALQLPESSERF